MSNAQITVKFFSVIKPAAVTSILENIARNYGISTEDARAEVTDPEAESLLDYVTGSTRAATAVLMRGYGFCV